MELSDPQLQLNDANINKYRTAGNVVNRVLNSLINMIKPEALVMDICKKGDQLLIEELRKVYSKIAYKGISFPTCININNIGAYFTTTCDETVIIKEDDIIKIELGAHIDGFPALQVYTVYVQGNTPLNLSSKQGRVIQACSEASREILKVLKPKHKNTDVVKILERVAKKYDCTLPTVNDEGVAPNISYQISRNIIDGYNEDDDEFVHQIILCKDNEEVYGYRLLEEEFMEDDVYAIDVTFCSGSGKLNRLSDFVNLYKRDHKNRCNLKLKSSRQVINKIKGWFPINIDSNLDNRFRLGLKECVSKDLLTPYIPVTEKEGEFIGRVKFTVIVRKKPILITGRSLDPQINKFVK